MRRNDRRFFRVLNFYNINQKSNLRKNQICEKIKFAQKMFKFAQKSNLHKNDQICTKNVCFFAHPVFFLNGKIQSCVKSKNLSQKAKVA